MSPPFDSIPVRCVVAVCVVASCAPSRALADSTRTCSLSWVELPGDRGCGGAPAIARAVEERLGRQVLVSPSQADLSIEVRAERTGHPPFWHAVVQLRDREGVVLGSREFQSASDDCAELRASVALATALMIDPDAALRPSPALPSSDASPLPPAVPATPPLPVAAPAPPVAPVTVERVERPVPLAAASTASWRVAPSAAFALGFGVLPSMAAGVRVGIALSPPHFWGLEAFGGIWGDQTASAEGGAQVRFSLPYGGVAVCPLRIEGPGRPTFEACAGVEFGFLGSESSGFTTSRSSTDSTVSLVLPAHLTVPIAHRVAARLGGELGAGVVRDQFVYEDPAGTHVATASPIVTASCDVGVSVSLP